MLYYTFSCVLCSIINNDLFSNSQVWWTAWMDRRPLEFQWLPWSNDFLVVDSNSVIIALLSLHPFTICITGPLCSLATVSITSIVTPTRYKKCWTSNTYNFIFTALYLISLFIFKLPYSTRALRDVVISMNVCDQQRSSMWQKQPSELSSFSPMTTMPHHCHILHPPPIVWGSLLHSK